MKERRIGRRQVLETLQNGHISEPLHQDVRGDWRCNVSWFYAGARLTVGVIFKVSDKGDCVVVATVFHFLRLEMGMSQKRLADCLGVDEQTVSLWERSKRRPAIAAERMLRLLYLEHLDGTTKVAELMTQWNDTDRQEEEGRHVFEDTESGWRMAA